MHGFYERNNFILRVAAVPRLTVFTGPRGVFLVDNVTISLPVIWKSCPTLCYDRSYIL